MIYTTAYDPSKTLLEVALENEHCDKISHGYCELYHKHFSTVRNIPSTRVLEIGTLVGLSSRLFRSYFHPDATIHTIDINDPITFKDFSGNGVQSTLPIIDAAFGGGPADNISTPSAQQLTLFDGGDPSGNTIYSSDISWDGGSSGSTGNDTPIDGGGA